MEKSLFFSHLVGQIWIEEDEEQERFSQKIQLTNSTLRIEHSFRPNIQFVRQQDLFSLSFSSFFSYQLIQEYFIPILNSME